MSTNHQVIHGRRVKGRKGLDHWNALIEEWLVLVERFCRLTAGTDAPYVYTERACVGTLAAAAWRSGWIALEEFQLEKSQGDGDTRLGRSDLYIGSSSRDEYIEAKYKPIALRSYHDIANQFQSVLARATNDVSEAQGNDRESVFTALGFFPLYAPVQTAYEEIDELIHKAIGYAVDGSAHVVGWTFPPEVRDARDVKQGAWERQNPGVIMMASNLEFV